MRHPKERRARNPLPVQAPASIRWRAKLESAFALFEAGQLSQARAVCEEVLQQRAEQSSALQLLGLICARAGDAAAALKAFGRAVQSEPRNALTHCFKATVHQELSQWREALASYDRAIAIKADYAEAYSNRGNVLMELGDCAVALASFESAIAFKPLDVEAHCNRGNALKALGRWQDSLDSYTRAIEIDPNFAEAHSNRGNALMELRQWAAALASFERAIAIRPDFAIAYYNRGNVLREMRRNEAAVMSFNRALELQPSYTAAYHNRGNALLDLAQYDAAIASYQWALSLDPQLKYLVGICRHARMHICDWDDLDSDLARITAGIERGEKMTPPFVALALLDSPGLQRRAARIWVRAELGSQMAPPAVEKRRPTDKIRLGYFSADFHEHPVSRLMCEVFETHDRRRFEVTAFSLGPDTQDDMRGRLRRAFDNFIDARDKSDSEIAQLAHRSAIDIAIDLSGFTQGCRPKILSRRAAPLQVSYIGYLGTMASEHIDYLIADPVIVPIEDHKHYSEKILYLPSYQANDSKRRIAEHPSTRQSLGLPATGCVFCCFNTNYKITPWVFTIWMRILAQVPQSVLLLYAGNAAAEKNLKKEAWARGVDPDRLIFAKRLAFSEYLARYRAADLFLDTLPYNAGATASDALWAGLPVLTCAGASFAGRVAASLLHAVGLPELITSSLERYESLAVELALQPQRLAAIKQRLQENLLTTPLFDTSTFTKHLETAFTKIHQRHHAGLPTEHVYPE